MDKIRPRDSASLPNSNSFDAAFNVSCEDENGSIINASVKQLTDDHFEAYIAEKEVVIHCTKDEHGVLLCKLNTKKNPAWVDRISEEIAKKVT